MKAFKLRYVINGCLMRRTFSAAEASAAATRVEVLRENGIAVKITPKRAAALLGVAALLAACTAPLYRDAGGAVATDRERAECDYEASKASASSGGGGEFGTSSPFRRAVVAQQCMRLKGYELR